MRRFFLVLIMFCLGASLTFSQASAIRYISVRNAELKESSWVFSRTLSRLSLGDVVTLISEDGRWANVRTETQSGWVLSSSLSVRRILPSGAGASASELALAGKGFSAEVEMEFRKNGLDYSMVDYMESIIITPLELLEFIMEGRLAAGN